MVKTKFRDYISEKNILFIEYFFLGAIILFSFFTMYYSDMLVTAEHSLILIEATLKGEFFRFYDYAVELSSFTDGLRYACYEIPIYIIFAIWNIPVYIITKLFGVSVFAEGCLLWYKLLVTIAMIICGKILYKIGLLLNWSKEKSQWIFFFFVSSILMIVCVAQLALYDIIYTVPALLGLYYYLKDDYKKFILCYAIAIPMKIIPVFLVLPLILLKQKKILAIIRDTIMVLFPWVFIKICFMHSEAYRFTAQFMGNHFKNLLFSKIKVLGCDASVLCILYFILCVYAFLRASNTKRNEFAIYLAFISMAIFFVCSMPASYWVVLMVPFMLLLVFSIQEQFVAYILELTLAISFMYIEILFFPAAIGGERTFSYLALTEWATEANSIGAFMLERDLSNYASIFNGFFMGAIVCMLILGYPLRKSLNTEDSVDRKDCSCHFAWIRLGVNLAWILLQIKIIF